MAPIFQVTATTDDQPMTDKLKKLTPSLALLMPVAFLAGVEAAWQGTIPLLATLLVATLIPAFMPPSRSPRSIGLLASLLVTSLLGPSQAVAVSMIALGIGSQDSRLDRPESRRLLVSVLVAGIAAQALGWWMPSFPQSFLVPPSAAALIWLATARQQGRRSFLPALLLVPVLSAAMLGSGWLPALVLAAGTLLWAASAIRAAPAPAQPVAVGLPLAPLVGALVTGVSAAMGRAPHRGPWAAAYAVAIGEARGLGREDLDALQLAALLAEGGEVLAPRLHESGAASRMPIDAHQADATSWWGTLLASAQLPRRVREAVEALPENWNGTGSPRRLAHTAIPITARILAIAQVLAERQDHNPGRMREVLWSAAGSRLDPQLVGQTVAQLGWIRDRARVLWAGALGQPSRDLTVALARQDHLLGLREELLLHRLDALLAARDHLDVEALELLVAETSTLLPLQGMAVVQASTADEAGFTIASAGFLSDQAANANEDRRPIPGTIANLVLQTRSQTNPTFQGRVADWLAGRLADSVSQLSTPSIRPLTLITDPLTGLGNREALERGFAQVLTVQRFQDRPFSLLMLRVEELVDLNAEHGFATGDRMLRAFALALQTTLRAGDVAARYGGATFAVILPDCDPQMREAVIARIDAIIQATHLRMSDGKELALRYSMGSASWPQDGSSMDDLIQSASWFIPMDPEGSVITRPMELVA